MTGILKKAIGILNRAERRKLGILIVCNLVISFVDIVSLALLVLLIGMYTQGQAPGGYLANLKWLSRDSITPITVFFALFILKSAFGYWVLSVQYSFVYQVASRISQSKLLQYLCGNYTDFVNIDSSIHIRQIMDQPIQFGHYILAGIQQIVTESILLAFTFLAIVVFNFKLFVLLTLVLFPPVLVIAWFNKRKLKQARANAKNSSEKSLQYLHEALSGYIESNIYDKSDFFTGRYTHYQQQMARHLADIQMTQAAPARFIETFAVMGLFLLVLANKFTGYVGAIEIVNIGAFMAAAYKIIPGIVKISNISGQIKTYEYTISDLAGSQTELHVPDTKSGIQSVVFSGISFTGHKHVNIDHFNLEISKGDFAGLTGPSGRGKTTIINFLLGFLSESSGSIVINGDVVNAAARRQYWRDISYVQQRPFLVNDTLSTNITLSGDSVGDVALEEIINAVGLTEFVGQSTDGINKIITENGKNISGGQRQRIAIARALYKNSDLTILDEPFSELDAKSEQVILKYLKTRCEKGKMIIMITHKKENLEYCNKTYSID